MLINKVIDSFTTYLQGEKCVYTVVQNPIKNFFSSRT